jgi:2',3'-cyclic-nucleotide 2'-phosphodiesterase (5'-nucleotidase family)
MISKLTLLFTSDEHGYVSAHSKLHKHVREARQENPDGTLLISSGDVFEGSVETGVLGIEASRRMLEAAKYDLITLGNHDFDRGAETARDWSAGAPCPVVLANVKETASGDLLPNASPYRVFEKNGIKVGLVGVTTAETTRILPAEKLRGLRFEDPTQAVKNQVEELKKQGVEVIGAVSHLGLPADQELARSVPELDFILGGHTHDALDQPQRVGQTLIAHPGCFRQGLGRLDLEIEASSGTIVGHSYKLQRPDSESEGDEMTSLAAGYAAQVEVAMGETLTNLPEPLVQDPNLLGDGMELLLGSAVLSKHPADMVSVNQKTIRAGLPGGPVKKRDIFNAFPFDNRLVRVTMPAREMAKIQADSLARADQTSLLVEGRLGVATDLRDRNIRLVEDRPVSADGIVDGEAINGRLQDSSLKSVACWVPDDRRLSMITSDYLLQGGLGYFSPGRSSEGDLGMMRDVVTEYLASR